MKGTVHYDVRFFATADMDPSSYMGFCAAKVEEYDYDRMVLGLFPFPDRTTEKRKPMSLPQGDDMRSVPTGFLQLDRDGECWEILSRSYCQGGNRDSGVLRRGSPGE